MGCRLTSRYHCVTDGGRPDISRGYETAGSLRGHDFTAMVLGLAIWVEAGATALEVQLFDLLACHSDATARVALKDHSVIATASGPPIPSKTLVRRDANPPAARVDHFLREQLQSPRQSVCLPSDLPPKAVISGVTDLDCSAAGPAGDLHWPQYRRRGHLGRPAPS